MVSITPLGLGLVAEDKSTEFFFNVCMSSLRIAGAPLDGCGSLPAHSW